MDPIGDQIAGNFVDGMMLSQDFAQLALLHRFNKKDLIWIITIVTAAGLDGDIPNPCVQDGFPRLLGYVLLQNRLLLEKIMVNANRLMNDDEFIASKTNGTFKVLYANARLGVKMEMLRREAIAEAAVTVGKVCYEQITAVNGPPPAFVVEEGGTGVATAKPPGGCGCASLIILGFTLGAAAGLWTLS